LPCYSHCLRLVFAPLVIFERHQCLNIQESP
jgi:hypothetical protein